MGCGASSQGSSKCLLTGKNAVILTLHSKQPDTHNSLILRFALPKPEQQLQLPAGQYVFLAVTDSSGKPVNRAFTPVSDPELSGFVDIAVKVYRPCPPRWPDGGRCTQLLESLQVGGTLNMLGPFGALTYQGQGMFELVDKGSKKVTRMKRPRVNMITGGSGITPMLQIMQAISKDPQDLTEVRLVYCNSTDADIMCRGMIDAASKRNPRLVVWHTVSKLCDPQASQWEYSVGRVTQALLLDKLHPPGPDVYTLTCGPAGLLEDAVHPALDALGYDSADRHEF